MKTKFRSAQVFLLAAVGYAGVVAACGGSDDSTFGNGSDGGTGGSQDGSGTFGEGGGFNNGDGGFQFTSLVFDPPTATIVLDGTGPGTASFTLKGKLPDGSTVDVTPQSVAFDHPGIATVTAAEPAVATASGPYGGVGQIHAVYNGQSATATLTVQLHIKEVGSGVSPGAVTALDGVTATSPNDPSNASGTMLYPYDQTVWPLGLASPTLQWNAPQANDVYRLHYEEANYTFDGYYSLATLPGRMNLAQSHWDQITASSAAATGADPLKFKLYRYDGSNAYFDAQESWTIAPASVNGAIYYWTTSGGGGLTRISPGAGSVPTPLESGKCMGCHGVSSDGTTLVAAVETGESTYRSWVAYDLNGGPTVGTRRVDSNLYGANIAVNHNGKYVVFGDNSSSPPTPSSSGLQFGDATTGALVAGSGVESFAKESWTDEYVDPAFSPGGTKLATVQADAYYGGWSKAELMVADFDETTHTFSGNKSLISYTDSHFTSAQWSIGYPSFTPDDNWIAFHVADWGAGCFSGGSCDANTPGISALWMINAAGGTPIKLSNLTDSSPNVNDRNEAFEPTFNPIERGGYYWVVFTSERTWGNTLTTGYGKSGAKRLWVAAIDKSIGTIDPSHPPFYIEGQVSNTMNMRGFWTLSACIPTGATNPDGGASCTAGYECCSGFCDSGTCVDVTQVACKNIGDTCTATSDCCNSDIVSCVSGKCQQNVR